GSPGRENFSAPAFPQVFPLSQGKSRAEWRNFPAGGRGACFYLTNRRFCDTFYDSMILLRPQRRRMEEQMALLTKAPRGTQDILPAKIAPWQAMERELIATAQRFGFQEIRTPTFEHTE